ncbi:hypothetical protein JXB01_03820 [Candidatus Micrarchaeota archaeon]|nr:hypothetical protein [Candidatus Micrarchaeota archaeon]
MPVFKENEKKKKQEGVPRLDMIPVKTKGMPKYLQPETEFGPEEKKKPKEEKGFLEIHESFAYEQPYLKKHLNKAGPKDKKMLMTSFSVMLTKVTGKIGDEKQLFSALNEVAKSKNFTKELYPVIQNISENTEGNETLTALDALNSILKSPKYKKYSKDLDSAVLNVTNKNKGYSMVFTLDEISVILENKNFSPADLDKYQKSDVEKAMEPELF